MRFQQIYSRMLEEAYPYFELPSKPGVRLVRFPFRRIFIVALK